MPAPIKNKLEHYLSRTITDQDGWQGATQSNGYGSVRIDNQKIYIHVYVGLQTHQEDLDRLLEDDTVDPKTIVVMHKCDKRACINPSCLVVATQRDNIKDAVAKGRMYIPEPNRQFTADQIQEMRQLREQGYSVRSIARQYGINQGNMSRILRSLSYAS
jgi:hypothetical protein